MYEFSKKANLKALAYLSFFHVLIIASSNYLVQIPLEFLGFHVTWGALSFPFIFLATDLTIRIFGAKSARWIVFYSMFPALIFSYIISVIFANGSWLGFGQLGTFNLFVARIVFASLCAYAVGQLMDIFIFNKLRKLSLWWIAPSVSTIFGNAIDTFIFFFIAFYKTSDIYLSNHLVEIAVLDYIFKIMICLIFFVPAYGVILNHIIKKYFPKEKLIS